MTKDEIKNAILKNFNAYINICVSKGYFEALEATEEDINNFKSEVEEFVESVDESFPIDKMIRVDVDSDEFKGILDKMDFMKESIESGLFNKRQLGLIAEATAGNSEFSLNEIKEWAKPEYSFAQMREIYFTQLKKEGRPERRSIIPDIY